MTGTESLASIDFDWDALVAGGFPVVGTMNKEPARMDGGQFPQCFGHPINVSHRFMDDVESKTVLAETIADDLVPMVGAVLFNVDSLAPQA